MSWCKFPINGNFLGPGGSFKVFEEELLRLERVITLNRVARKRKKERTAMEDGRSKFIVLSKKDF